MELHGQIDLHGRNLLKEIDFTPEEFLHLVDLGGRLRAEKRAARPPGRPGPDGPQAGRPAGGRLLAPCRIAALVRGTVSRHT